MTAKVILFKPTSQLTSTHYENNSTDSLKAATQQYSLPS